MATTGICDSWKSELMQSAHCLNATGSTSGTTHSNQVVDGISSTAGLAVGMSVSGGDIAASSVIESITSNVAITVTRTHF
jgi:hypothetical protein